LWMLRTSAYLYQIVKSLLMERWIIGMRSARLKIVQTRYMASSMSRITCGSRNSLIRTIIHQKTPLSQTRMKLPHELYRHGRAIYLKLLNHGDVFELGT